jgi:hypothetical protein
MKICLEDGASIATMIEALAVAISLFFIWRQISQQTKLAKIARTQELVSLSSPFNLELINNDGMADLWVNGSKKYQGFDEVRKYQYKSMLIWWLIFHENVYYQHKERLLDEAIYMSWEYDLDDFVKRQPLEPRWEELKAAFQEEFRNHVTDLITKYKLPVNPSGNMTLNKK